MSNYHNHYFKKDVLLLADVFEKFIDTWLKFYGLDPCHYFSSPGLSWTRMLKLIGVRLEKILEIDMYLFILVIILVLWIELGCDVKNDWCKVRKHFRY